MELQFSPVILLYLLAAVVCFLLSYRAWAMRPARGANMWGGVMFSCGLWSIGSVLELSAADLAWKLILVRISYVGITGTIFFWILFVLTYCHYERWVNKRTILLLAIVPVAMNVIVLTLDAHTLLYRSVELVRFGNLWVVSRKFGPAFWMWAAYAYFCILVGSIIIIQAVIRFPDLYKRQALLLILATLVPAVSNVLYVTGHNPMRPFDPSCVAFTITGILITLGMRRFHLLDLVPVAYDLVFKNVNSAVVIVDNKGRIMQMNPVAERILNCSQNAVIGAVVTEAFPQYREHIQRFRTILEVKTEIRLGEGDYELQMMPLADHWGEVVGRIILLYDITETKKVMEERERLIRELDAYAHSVAHDLKAPLSVITGYLGLFEQAREQLPDRLQKVTPIVGQSARKMSSIIDNLLLLASVRKSREIRSSILDMESIVDDSLSRLRRAIEESGAGIRRPESWPVAFGYAPWVEEIWANLVSNAIKYGGKPPVVELGAGLHENGMVRFWVRDNGAGLSPTEQAGLFREFSRTDPNMTVEGYGLGLSIAVRIANRLGGEVGVESEKGKGSLFYFTLPSGPPSHFK